MECEPGVHQVYTMQDKGWHGHPLNNLVSTWRTFHG